MASRKTALTIYVTLDQAERLRQLNERTKVPVAVYIREGVDMMLSNYEHVLAKPGDGFRKLAATVSDPPQSMLACATAPAKPR